MIGSLRGEVLERWNDGTVLIDVGGVGYEVTVSPRAFGELEPTTSAFLYIHHHIREDDQTLYGFLTRDERSTFKTLIATHGVGPKTAQRLLVELRDRLSVPVLDGDLGASGTGGGAATSTSAAGGKVARIASASAGPTPWVAMSVLNVERSSRVRKPYSV